MESFKINDIVKGEVIGLTKYGVFVSLEDDYIGMVHISEVSNKFIPDLKTKFRIGDIINVKVLNIDESTRHAVLSIKKINYKAKAEENGIEESGQGFTLLKEQMDEWIKEKMIDLQKK